jgi:hypothetical protein
MANLVYHPYITLVSGFKHEFYVPFQIWDVILPIDELIFFKMGFLTTNQIYIYYYIYSIYDPYIRSIRNPTVLGDSMAVHGILIRNHIYIYG